MASQSQETIKEFLVALGFKIDEAGSKRFSSAISGATKDVFKLGAAVAGTVAITDAFVSRIAAGMDKLYFASKRTGSTIGQINSFSYAISQLGGSSEGARQAIESLAQFRRTYLGADSILQGLGVDPKHLNNSVASLRDLSAQFQRLYKQGISFQELRQRADMIGLGSENDTLLTAMLDGSLFTLMDKRDRQIKESGIDMERLASSNRDFNQSLADTEGAWHLVGLQLEDHLLPAMKDFNSWSEKLAMSLPKWMDRLGDGLLELRDSDSAGIWENARKGFHYLFGDIGQSFIDGGEDDKLGKSYRDAAERNKALRGFVKGGKSMGAMGNRSAVASFLQQAGWSGAQTAGIMANLIAESALNPNASGDHGSAWGIAQWRGQRQADFKRLMGRDIHGSTLQEQLHFLQYELSQGKYRGIGDRLRTINDPAYAASLVTRGYERPRDVLGDSAKRGAMANSIAPTLNQTNNINVTTTGDGKSVASQISTQVEAAGNRVVRNMQSAVK